MEKYVIYQLVKVKSESNLQEKNILKELDIPDFKSRYNTFDEAFIEISLYPDKVKKLQLTILPEEIQIYCINEDGSDNTYTAN